MPSEIVKKCSRMIAEKKLNIAFAESATAGRMCAEFSLTDESGKILRGGIGCYEVFVKEQIMNVPHNYIEQYTAESAEVTQKLAESCSKIFNAKISVAVTGLTTSGGSETDEKPVGTIFLYIITPKTKINHREVFSGSPEKIVLQAIDRAASLIVKSLIE
jgi:nicotinamide-nucleotide amidase